MRANTTQQVIEYLSKKGYTKTEQMLRAESANQDAEGKPVSVKSEPAGGMKYREVFGKFSVRHHIWSSPN